MVSTDCGKRSGPNHHEYRHKLQSLWINGKLYKHEYNHQPVRTTAAGLSSWIRDRKRIGERVGLGNAGA